MTISCGWQVYRGAYKREACAIKLIFTVDLTTDIIRRVCAEAEILSSFKVPILAIAVIYRIYINI